MSKKNASKPLSCTIDSFEDRFVKLAFTGDGIDPKTILISKKYLPKNSKIGDELNIKLYTSAELGLTDKNLAQYVLDEIIGDGK